MRNKLSIRRKREGEGGGEAPATALSLATLRGSAPRRARKRRVLLPLRHLVNKRSELSRSRRMLPRTISFSVRLTPVARPQPTPIYPVALQLMCSRVEPCPSAPLTYPLQFQFSFYRPPILHHTPSRTHQTRDLGFTSARENVSLTLSFSFSLPSIRSFLSSSPSLSLRVSFASPPLSVLRSAALFVLEIRRGLPDPPFSCAVINYYLLAIHPRTRYPRRGYAGGN